MIKIVQLKLKIYLNWIGLRTFKISLGCFWFFFFDIFAKICLTIKFNPKDFMIIYVKDSILYGASRRGESLLGIVDHLPFTPGELA